MLLLNRWYPAYTRARFEQNVSRLLAEKGYGTFVPVYKTRRRCADGIIKIIELPLFPN